VFLRYVFNRLSVENDLSLVAVVTGKEAKIFKSVYIEGYMFSLHSAKADTTFVMGYHDQMIVFLYYKHYIFDMNTAEGEGYSTPPWLRHW